MHKQNKKWDSKLKEKIVLEVMKGATYSEVCSKYGISSTGMVANWKRDYLNGKPLNGRQGRKSYDKDMEYEILKKSFALLKEIRGESPDSKDIE